VVPATSGSGSPSPASGGWSPPLFLDRLASGTLLPLGPTRLKRNTLDGPQGAGDALVYGSPCGPVIITLRVEDGPFTGVWFNTTRTPWDTDVDCARDAARELGCVLRCDPGVTVGTAPRVASAFLEIAGANERLVDWHPGR
jgi:hypothetical protein